MNRVGKIEKQKGTTGKAYVFFFLKKITDLVRTLVGELPHHQTYFGGMSSFDSQVVVGRS